MSLDEDLCNEYQFQRGKLSQLPDADLDFITLDNACYDLNDNNKLKISINLIKAWRKRCIHAESLLTKDQKEEHLKLYFSNNIKL